MILRFAVTIESGSPYDTLPDAEKLEKCKNFAAELLLQSVCQHRNPPFEVRKGNGLRGSMTLEKESPIW